MTAVAIRPTEAPPIAPYRRALPAGVRSIAAVTGLVLAWAVIAFVALSATIGAGALVFAAVVGWFDANFATATRIEVTPESVTLGFWRRTKRYAAKAIVVTHDVRSDRFSLRRRNKRHALLHFHDDDPAAVVAFLVAGVEIISI